MATTRPRSGSEAKRAELFNMLSDTTPKSKTNVANNTNAIIPEIQDLSDVGSGMDLTEDDLDVDAMNSEILLIQQDPSLQKMIKEGVDLRDYSRNIEKQLKEVEAQSVQECMKFLKKLIFFHPFRFEGRRTLGRFARANYAM